MPIVTPLAMQEANDYSGNEPLTQINTAIRSDSQNSTILAYSHWAYTKSKPYFHVALMGFSLWLAIAKVASMAGGSSFYGMEFVYWFSELIGQSVASSDDDFSSPASLSLAAYFALSTAISYTGTRGIGLVLTMLEQTTTNVVEIMQESMEDAAIVALAMLNIRRNALWHETAEQIANDVEEVAADIHDEKAWEVEDASFWHPNTGNPGYFNLSCYRAMQILACFYSASSGLFGIFGGYNLAELVARLIASSFDSTCDANESPPWEIELVAMIGVSLGLSSIVSFLWAYNLKKIREYYVRYFIYGEKIAPSTWFYTTVNVSVFTIASAWSNLKSGNLLEDNVFCHWNVDSDWSWLTVLIVANSVITNIFINGILTLGAIENKVHHEELSTLLARIPSLKNLCRILNFGIVGNAASMFAWTLISVLRWPGELQASLKPLAFFWPLIVTGLGFGAIGGYSQYKLDRESKVYMLELYIKNYLNPRIQDATHQITTLKGSVPAKEGENLEAYLQKLKTCLKELKAAASLDEIKEEKEPLSELDSPPADIFIAIARSQQSQPVYMNGHGTRGNHVSAQNNFDGVETTEVITFPRPARRNNPYLDYISGGLSINSSIRGSGQSLWRDEKIQDEKTPLPPQASSSYGATR